MTRNTVYGIGGYDPAKPYGNAIWQSDDETLTTTDFTTTPPTVTPYTPAEAQAAAARNAAAAAAAVQATLTADATADLTKLTDVITALATLLGPATTVGSIRAVMGTTADPAGTTTLRAIKNVTNATINASAATYIKALADLTITLAQRVINGDAATRRMARQTLRLAKDMVGDYSTADVGSDIA